MFPERPYGGALGPGQNGSQSLQRRPYFAPKRVFKRSFDVFRRKSRIRSRSARSRGRTTAGTLSQQYSGPAARKNHWITWENSGRATKNTYFHAGNPTFLSTTLSTFLSTYKWTGMWTVASNTACSVVAYKEPAPVRVVGYL